MKNQRQFLRKALHCTVSLFDEQCKCVGTMVDYSESGIMIASYQPINVEQTFTFNMFDLPKYSGNKRSGQIKVHSVWCEKIDHTQFGTGFKLLSSDSNAQTMFSSYDESHINS